jgi:hypothetical protein
MLRQHSLAVRIVLAKANSLQPDVATCQREPADAAEQIDVRHSSKKPNADSSSVYK